MENKTANTTPQDTKCTLTALCTRTKKSSLSHGKIIRESNVCWPYIHKGNSFFSEDFSA